MKQFLLFFLLVCNVAYSQIQFNASRPNPVDGPIENGLSIGVSDINGDLFDDIIAFDQGKDLWIGYQTDSKKWIWKSYHLISKTQLINALILQFEKKWKNDSN